MTYSNVFVIPCLYIFSIFPLHSSVRYFLNFDQNHSEFLSNFLSDFQKTHKSE